MLMLAVREELHAKCEEFSSLSGAVQTTSPHPNQASPVPILTPSPSPDLGLAAVRGGTSREGKSEVSDALILEPDLIPAGGRD